MLIRIEYNGDKLDGRCLMIEGTFRLVPNFDRSSMYRPEDVVEAFDGASLAEAVAFGTLTTYVRRGCDFLNRLQRAAQNYCAWNGHYCVKCKVVHVGHPATWHCYQAELDAMESELVVLRKAK